LSGEHGPNREQLIRRQRSSKDFEGREFKKDKIRPKLQYVPVSWMINWTSMTNSSL